MKAFGERETNVDGKTKKKEQNSKNAAMIGLFLNPSRNGIQFLQAALINKLPLINDDDSIK